MDIAADSAGVKPNMQSAPKNVMNIPSCAAAPISILFGFAINGPKSVITPIPRNIIGGKITQSTPLYM